MKTSNEQSLQIIHAPYLLFVGDAEDASCAKTAIGVNYWRPEQCGGQLRFEGCPINLDLPDFSVDVAVEAGLKTIVVGVAPAGGDLSETWIEHLVHGLEVGLDVASGLHTKLKDIEVLRETARKCGRQIFDVRYTETQFPIATGQRRTGKRLLTVGTDCAVGKMYTTLALDREMNARGFKADFRATGQTGILIAGTGVSVDAVVSDFVAGASETLSPANDPDHWDLIEGQGSLFHPSYAGVSLGLLHGSQPDVIVVCHDVSRRDMIGTEGYPPADIQACIDLNLQLARLTNPGVVCGGISLNTSTLSNTDALQYLADLQDETELPCVDPVRTGVRSIVTALADALI